MVKVEDYIRATEKRRELNFRMHEIQLEAIRSLYLLSSGPKYVDHVCFFFILAF